MVRNASRLHIATVALLFSTCAAWPQNMAIDADTEATLRSGPVSTQKSHPSIEACWAAWKQREGLEEGQNRRNNSLILVAQAQQRVLVEPGSTRWLAARSAAFSQAEMAARGDLARVMRFTIGSDRSLSVQDLGGDEAPENLKPVVQQLSVADKARILTDKALDNEIKKFDPAWRGDAPTEQKRSEIVKLTSRVKEHVARHAEQYISGAFTAVQCEGPSEQDDGAYSLLVGLIWSPKLARVAETIWNPTAPAIKNQPYRPLREQFEAFKKDNPEWLAYANGARVFTDENGHPVIVGFGVAPRSSLMSADQSRANLMAVAAIQRYVGEMVAADDGIKSDFSHRKYLDGNTQNLDMDAYNLAIALKAKQMQLTGATTVASWRGEHPWSRTGMQVVVVAWTRQWNDDYSVIRGEMNEQERRMRGQGAVPSSGGNKPALNPNDGVAAPARTGVGARTSDF